MRRTLWATAITCAALGTVVISTAGDGGNDPDPLAGSASWLANTEGNLYGDLASMFDVDAAVVVNGAPADVKEYETAEGLVHNLEYTIPVERILFQNRGAFLSNGVRARAPEVDPDAGPIRVYESLGVEQRPSVFFSDVEAPTSILLLTYLPDADVAGHEVPWGVQHRLIDGDRGVQITTAIPHTNALNAELALVAEATGLRHEELVVEWAQERSAMRAGNAPGPLQRTVAELQDRNSPSAQWYRTPVEQRPLDPESMPVQETDLVRAVPLLLTQAGGNYDRIVIESPRGIVLEASRGVEGPITGYSYPREPWIVVTEVGEQRTVLGRVEARTWTGPSGGLGIDVTNGVLTATRIASDEDYRARVQELADRGTSAPRDAAADNAG